MQLPKPFGRYQQEFVAITYKNGNMYSNFVFPYRMSGPT